MFQPLHPIESDSYVFLNFKKTINLVILATTALVAEKDKVGFLPSTLLSVRSKAGRDEPPPLGETDCS